MRSIYCLSILPVFSAFATAKCDDSKATKKAFDPESLTLREVGARNTVDWRVWLEQDGNPISFWHDVPLYPDEKNNNIVNIYVEIPRWTDAKIETKRNKPLSEQYLSTVDDLEKYRPGLKQTFYDWFVYYKLFRSGSLNTIFENKYQDSNTARDIVGESHGFWKDLISGKEDPGKISISQTSQTSVCNSYIASKDATDEFDLPKKSKIEPAAPRPAKYDTWYYIDENFRILPEQVIDVD
ncbi:hypothetical protein ACHAPX_003255 [Trichoderma viride]